MQQQLMKLASAFSILVGAAGLLMSLWIYWLFSVGAAYSVPMIGPILQSLIGQTLYLGLAAVVASVLHIAVGVLLLKKRRLGRDLGIALSACEIFGYLSVLLLPKLAVPMVISLAVGSALIMLLILTWDDL